MGSAERRAPVGALRPSTDVAAVIDQIRAENVEVAPVAGSDPLLVLEGDEPRRVLGDDVVPAPCLRRPWLARERGGAACPAMRDGLPVGAQVRELGRRRTADGDR